MDRSSTSFYSYILQNQPPIPQVVEYSEATFPDLMPRLGYLFQDNNLDEGAEDAGRRMTLSLSSSSGKLSAGVQKFLLKESTEGTNVPEMPRTKYSQISYVIDLKEGLEEVATISSHSCIWISSSCSCFSTSY